MTKQSRREQRQERAKQKRRTQSLIRGTIIAVAAGGILYFAWIILRPQVGETVPVLSSSHLEEGQALPVYNSNPPTSGDHYTSPLPAGFYEETVLADLPPNSDGYLVHNLEHGYIIFWYDCTQTDDCETWISQLRNAMDEIGTGKLVAFPRSGLEAPVVMTSWGRKEPMPVFDLDAAKDFVLRNLNRAPEGGAP